SDFLRRRRYARGRRMSAANRDDSVWAVLEGGLVVHRTQPRHAEGLERLQIVVFPTLADAERFKAPHYRRHIELFPAGQFCVVDGHGVVLVLPAAPGAHPPTTATLATQERTP